MKAFSVMVIGMFLLGLFAVPAQESPKQETAPVTIEMRPLAQNDAIEAKVLLRAYMDFDGRIKTLEKELEVVRKMNEEQKTRILRFQLKKLEEAKLSAEEWIVDFENGQYVKIPKAPPPAKAE